MIATTTKGFSRKAMLTGIWKTGCSLTTRENLREGQDVWLKAKDDTGNVILSVPGVVIWSESCYRPDGYRCKVRFRPPL
jgi:hypothetical protein